jgi:hypothetical protein
LITDTGEITVLFAAGIEGREVRTEISGFVDQIGRFRR